MTTTSRIPYDNHFSALAAWAAPYLEDHWRYEKAAGDVYFSPDSKPTVLDTRSSARPRTMPPFSGACCFSE
jgi:hypothetical protein